jgi:hypothetical protein
VALLQLLAAVYLAILSAGVGFRLDTCPAALICFSVTSIILSLPATILTQSQGAYFEMMQVALLQLLGRSLFGDNFSWRGFQAGFLSCPLRF